MWNGVFNYSNVECSGDAWYCDTELLSKMMKWVSPPSNRPDFWGENSGQLSSTDVIHLDKKNEVLTTLVVYFILWDFKQAYAAT